MEVLYDPPVGNIPSTSFSVFDDIKNGLKSLLYDRTNDPAVYCSFAVGATYPQPQVGWMATFRVLKTSFRTTKVAAIMRIKIQLPKVNGLMISPTLS